MTGWLDIGAMDDLGRADTPVHRLDARAKALVAAAFIVTVVSFGRYDVSALAPLLAYPLAMMAAGRIPPNAIYRKILLAMPFALAIAIFNPVLDRTPVAQIGSAGITGGWLSFASIMLRFVLTVSAALVLVATTGIHGLAAGLERLRVPRPFVLQLLFLYRYLFVIAHEGSRMTRCVAMRSTRPGALPIRVYGSLVGNLLLRSISRAERVYRAMAARGFDGTIRVQGRTSLRPADMAFVCGWCFFFAAARTWNLAAIIGSMATGGMR